MTDRPTRRTTLLLSFARAQDLEDVYVNTGPAGALDIPGRADAVVGEVVDLEIAFIDDLMVFHALGLVRERRMGMVRGRPAGILIELLPREARTRDIILDFARGRNRSFVRRRPRRYPVQMEVEMALDNTFVRVQIHDLNREGAFLLTQDLLDSGTLVALRFPGAQGKPPLTINAEVAWRQTSPKRGIGVRFLVGEEGKQEEIDRLVDRLVKEQLAAK
ncbi:MAG: PilZ domain-containing protein [Deltaproteobacteria bacterium]|nr:PilZ domain-containing protein [Deltaproteobacteria bacterium]